MESLGEGTPHVTLGNRLRRARQRQRLSQREVARRLGIGRTRIQELEGGRNTNPTLETLRSLAEVLHVSIGYLTGEETSDNRWSPHVRFAWKACIHEGGNQSPW